MATTTAATAAATTIAFRVPDGHERAQPGTTAAAAATRDPSASFAAPLFAAALLTTGWLCNCLCCSASDSGEDGNTVHTRSTFVCQYAVWIALCVLGCTVSHVIACRKCAHGTATDPSRHGQRPSLVQRDSASARWTICDLCNADTAWYYWMGSTAGDSNRCVRGANMSRMRACLVTTSALLVYLYRTGSGGRDADGLESGTTVCAVYSLFSV